ncbi:hypothetical protein N7466_010504 [Penicillium verhagenii]|uniref:uncharacterized protein n=1 Tax=Penicillium verhagenii TaxID=1562060 RepID=UPI0025458C1C|nr:uncharacterized protein N7466_010504 [Penicillium verhagenii]KAJ5918512.1 hypothetical protein N7466_010504 [Penicillium verhagenii]
MPIGLLSHAEICAKFDRLVSNGIIAYQPSKPVLVTDQGMIFCFHVVQTLKSKPQADDKVHVLSSGASESDPHSGTFGPGSDLARDHPDIFITIVNDTHYLVHNKFPVFRPMLLLLTVDSYRRQHEALDREDLDAGWQMICEMKEEHYVFFNCGVLAGSSRAHKHLQVIPAPGADDRYGEGFKFFPDYDSVPEEGPPGFVHLLQQFRDLPGDPVINSELVLEIYMRLLRQARELLNVQEGDPCPHNFILTKRWMMVVPRQAKLCHGITANSAAMVGSVYLDDPKQLDAWKEVGPMKVLASLGLPREQLKN